MYSSAAIFSYLNLHVEVSFLALFPLLCLHPFLLLQSLHQLLGDVYVSHWLEHLTWGIRQAVNIWQPREQSGKPDTKMTHYSLSLDSRM